MSCPCPNPANCSPTFCHFSDADLPVTMYEPPEQPAVQMPPSLARAANERIRRLEAGRAHLLTISDAPGNWWDRLKWYQRLGVVCGVIWAVGLLVVTR